MKVHKVKLRIKSIGIPMYVDWDQLQEYKSDSRFSTGLPIDCPPSMVGFFIDDDNIFHEVYLTRNYT